MKQSDYQRTVENRFRQTLQNPLLIKRVTLLTAVVLHLKTHGRGEHRRGEGSGIFLERQCVLSLYIVETLFPSKAFLKQRKTFLESKYLLTPSGSPPPTLDENGRRTMCFIQVTVRVPQKMVLTESDSFRETKDTVRVSLQECLFTGSSKATFCGFWQKRVRLSGLLEGGLAALQEPTLTVLLVLPKFFFPLAILVRKRFWRFWFLVLRFDSCARHPIFTWISLNTHISSKKN